LPGHVLEKTFGAVSFAHGDTRTPMLTALSGLTATIVGGILLFPHYGHVGVAAAVGLSAWVGAALLGVILYRRGWLRLDSIAARRLPRIALATVVMSAAVLSGLIASDTQLPLLSASWFGRIGMLAVLVSLGVAVYLATLQVLDVARLKDLVAAARRRE
jgi:putative peptidoglycan lipid II flippase